MFSSFLVLIEDDFTYSHTFVRIETTSRIGENSHDFDSTKFNLGQAVHWKGKSAVLKYFVRSLSLQPHHRILDLFILKYQVPIFLNGLAI